MSWFGSTKYPQFEEKICEATSESIPNGDIDFATALEVSDMIRSKQVPPKEAMRALKKRFMDADNINMQKSAFKLIDFCIKNGGLHFINEIASKEFMDPLIAVIKNKDINESLKTYLLENIQTWSIMVSTNSKFDYINDCYKKLQNDGFEFPMIKDVIDSNMIDSKVAPEWQDSDACMMCSKMFTFINRKHHCRSCGGVFCAQHSSKTIELPELGINIPVRVCDNCYADHKENLKKHKKHKKKKSIDDANGNDHILSDDDDEIKKAIALSLKENATKNSYNPTSNVNATVTKDYDDDDEDEQMKAAIIASLQDINNTNTQIEKSELPKETDTSTGLYSNLLAEKPLSSNIPVTSQDTSQSYLHQQYPQYVNQPLTSQIPQTNLQQLNNQQQQQQQQQIQIELQQHPHLQSQPQSQLFQQTEQTQQAQQYSDTAAQYITGKNEQKIVDFIVLLDNQKKLPTSSPINPNLIQLRSEMILLHPKITTAINKEHSEIEKYQSLYSKLFVIGRLYDDILQNRLKQEQEMLKSQYTNVAPTYTSSNVLTNNYQQFQTPQQLQYMSPQSTFGLAPPAVHQLQASQQQQQQQMTGSYHLSNVTPSISTQPSYLSNISIPLNYSVPESVIPISKPQQPLQSEQQFHTYSANNMPSVPSGLLPSSPYDEIKQSNEPNNTTLTTESVSTEPSTQSQNKAPEKIESVSTIESKKEPEIANLIDL